MKLTNTDLQRIYDIAKSNWQTRANVEIESHLYPLACMLEAFAPLARQNGINLNLELPEQRHPEPIDDYEPLSIDPSVLKNKV